MANNEEVIDPEVVEEAEEIGRKFDEEFKREVLERDLFRCQICGDDENLQVAHIPKGYEDGRDMEKWEQRKDQGHRGMGGREVVNRVENCMTLCYKHHQQLDSSRGLNISIERWVPDDKENGLIVLDNSMRRIPNEELYFYALPPKEKIEDAHQVHNQLMQSLDAMLDNFHSSLELLYWIKEKELYRAIPSPGLKTDFYNSFKDYYLNEVKSKFGYKLTLNSIYTYHTAIAPLMERVDDPKERHKVKRGNLPALSSILNDKGISEENKQKAIELAKGRQDEFKKFKRDLDIEEKGIERVKTCFHCMRPIDFPVKSFEVEGIEVKKGTKRLDYCRESEYLLCTMSHTHAEQKAEQCEQFQPKD